MRKSGPAFGQMSASGQKRNSKWDLKEESRSSFENVQDTSWVSSKAAGGNRPKWSHRDENIDEDCNRPLKAMATWDGDEGYGTRMSPGLDEWRQQKRHTSPKNYWKRSRRSRSHSRSRSRSPIHAYREELGGYDRDRSRSSVSSQLCKDFIVGKCRRGNHCHFLHEGAETYEDSWERRGKTVASKYSPYDSREYSMGSGRPDLCTDFFKGNCRRGASCRFSHHGASNASGRGPANEAIREIDNERRHKYASPERSGEHETRRAADIPCKFFAVGNCRKGKHCRFSHHDDQARVSPDQRLRDGRSSLHQNSDNLEKLWDGSKWSDVYNPKNAEKLSEDKNEKMDTPEKSVPVWPTDDRWGHNFRGNRSVVDPPSKPKLVMSSKNDASQWRTENTSNNAHLSEQRSTENWMGDMEMSPEWNSKVQPPIHVVKGEHTSLPSCEPGITMEASGRMHDATAVMPSMMNETTSSKQDLHSREVCASAMLNDDKGLTGINSVSPIDIAANILAAQGFNQNGLSSNALPTSCIHVAAQNQAAIPPDISRGGSMQNVQNKPMFQEGKIIIKPDFGDVNATRENSAIPTSQSTVSGEQLAQLSNLSASLAQLIANGQQLPQLFAAHGSDNVGNAPSFNNSEGLVKPDSAMTVEQSLVHGQYDPIGQSIESEKHDASKNPPGFSPKFMRQKSNTDGKLEMQSKNLSPSQFASAPNGGDININKDYQLNHLELGANSEVSKESNKEGTEESRKVQEENMTAKENNPLETEDGNGKAEENKKIKDVKGNRAFKFALVEFVKELLKPTWKEGSMSKDSYKNIVKKVVDKVTGTVQGSNIPQTQEKIEQYLSSAKPKLTKLVQAYVEKFQKDK